VVVAERVELVNGAYDFPIAPAVALTLGGGIGAGFVTAHDFPFEIDTGERTEFAYQLIAGLVWSINPLLDLQVDYRWCPSPRPSMTS
jgi:opacity protein-like surface antigen